MEQRISESLDLDDPNKKRRKMNGGTEIDEGLVTGKRRAQEHLDGGRAERKKQQGAVGSENEEDFPGPKLGNGPVWRLRAGNSAADGNMDEKDGPPSRYGVLLEQALSCSPLADVQFVFDDGESHVHAHREMLCCVSGEFRGMFESGMVEAKSGVVPVRGVGLQSFRGFLEYLYLGWAGEEMAKADGREVWILADLYDVQAVKDWLEGDGLIAENVCCAVQYALEGDGFLSGLLEACKKLAVQKLTVVKERDLGGVGAGAARTVLLEFLAGRKDFDRADRKVIEGFNFVDRWARGNGGLGYGDEGVASLVGLLDLGQVCPQDLMDRVRPSGLVRSEDLNAVEFKGWGRLEGKELEIADTFGSGGELACFVAVGHQVNRQRVAVSDPAGHRVRVFDVASGACRLVLEEGHGRLKTPQGVAFNDRGELIVVDSGNNRVCVFDGSGGFVREFGASRAGQRNGLKFPHGVAVNGSNDIFVADTGNDRIVMYRGDGTFVRSIESSDRDKELDSHKFSYVHGLAVNSAGLIIVSGARVTMLDDRGGNVSNLVTPGALFNPCQMVAVGAHDEILLVDHIQHSMHLLTGVGQKLQYLQEFQWKRDIISSLDNAEGFVPAGVCIDAQGVFFVYNKATRKLLKLHAAVA